MLNSLSSAAPGQYLIWHRSFILNLFFSDLMRQKWIPHIYQIKKKKKTDLKPQMVNDKVSLATLEGLFWLFR